MKHKMHQLSQASIVSIVIIMLTSPGVSHALPIADPHPLDPNHQVFADPAIFRLKAGWTHSGTLGGNDDFDSEFFFAGITGGGTRHVTGSRSHSHGPLTYAERFTGQYQNAPALRGWGPSAFLDSADLFTASLGSIGTVWGAIPGWRSPSSASEQFAQTWELTKKILRPGELGCPVVFKGDEVKDCSVQETWWGGGARLKGDTSFGASIENDLIGDETVTLSYQLDRIVTYAIDGSPALVGAITTGTREFLLREEGGLGDVNLAFMATFNRQDTEIQLSGNTVWKQSGSETSSANPGYLVPEAVTEKFIVDGVRDNYTERITDLPSMRLGIRMQQGTAADAFVELAVLEVFSDRKAVLNVRVPQPSTLILLAYTAISWLVVTRRLRSVASSVRSSVAGQAEAAPGAG